MGSNSRADGPADLLVSLDRGEPRRLRAQLEHALRDGIQSGRFPSGMALPPSRVLASEISVARSVVVGAYEQLIAEGYLQARQGAATTVVPRAASDGCAGGRRNGGVLGARNLSGVPDLALFPRLQWLRHYRAVLSQAPDAVFGYPDTQGVEELRRALSGYLGRVRSVQATPSDIVICSGFSHGLAMVCRALRRRGAVRLAVEDPCFGLHRRVIRAAGLEPVPVAVDEEGIDVARLSTLAVDGVVLSPAHSYPTGAVLGPGRRVELVAWARQHDGLIIEDDYDAEFRYDRLPVGALQGLAPQQIIYGGSASKMLSPALRLGWLAVPRHLIDDVVRAKFDYDITTEALGQLTLARFIDSGDLTTHLRRVRPRYRDRRDRLITALAQQMPEATPMGIEAGLHLYLRLPSHIDEDELVRRASVLGLLAEGARVHWADQAAAPPALLIGYSALHATEIERTATILGQLTHTP
ncbi:MAG: PLP-dependent aminotransferase family protein [Humibacillus sp.]|nr:PLP-dependent aminotransferase family protein [Humibacillus sp.]MDN5775935.1 PLP-dependent aminotransferase family protein [Humibacillus sp.]